MLLQPIYLFADSQPLFWNQAGTSNPETLFLRSIRTMITHPCPKAAYIGASNGDDPQFYSLFESAMAGVGIRDCRMISSSCSTGDHLFLHEADLILLAGGDVGQGWKVFNETGLFELITGRYHEGALLMGISAGAIHLGMFGFTAANHSFNKLSAMFQFVPFIIGAHEEKQDWETLKEAVRLANGAVKGIGIQAGGAMIYYPDQRIEAIRYPLYQFGINENIIRCKLIIPTQS